MGEITFLQTADAVVYREMIEVTAPTIREYCARTGFSYDCFLGVRHGSKPWHAALNRIVMLKEYSDRGYRGWVIYVDADAYVFDLGFDLATYLAGKGDFGLIAAASGIQPPRWWDINNGVFAINLGHQAGRRIVDLWYERLMSVPLDELNAETRWGQSIDDQNALHVLLENNEDDLRRYVFRDDAHPNTFNWQGRFIRQCVRDEKEPWEVRLAVVRAEVDEAMAGATHAFQLKENAISETAEARDARYAANHEFIVGLYQALLGREPDEGGYHSLFEKLRHKRVSYGQELAACMESDEFRSRRGH